MYSLGQRVDPAVSPPPPPMSFCDAFGGLQVKWLRHVYAIFLAKVGMELDSNIDSPSAEPSRTSIFARIPEDGAFPITDCELRFLVQACDQFHAHQVATFDAAAELLKCTIDKVIELWETMMWLLYYQRHRFFFTTEFGRVGFAPVQVQRGDAVCFLPLTKTLHVLSDDGRRYVTGAYVEGYMGEALLGVLPEEEEGWEWFDLR